jgi:hypothetical protein
MGKRFCHEIHTNNCFYAFKTQAFKGGEDVAQAEAAKKMIFSLLRRQAALFGIFFQKQLAQVRDIVVMRRPPRPDRADGKALPAQTHKTRPPGHRTGRFGQAI